MESDANNKKHNKRLSIVIFIILVIAIVLIVGYAYAKYVTSKRGEAQAEIAEWNVAIKINENTNENIVVDLADTRNNEKEEADVQDGYVAPGTAGKFNIEVNAENSDVSLEYEITMNTDYQNNQKFPKNLIFYSDESMQNAFYHTENAIKLNGFIGYNDSEKMDTIPIYWKWAYETGTTDEDREKNDELDSEWMGRTVEPLQLKIIARQVNTNQDENPMANQYAVTLDTNGGTLEGYGNSGKVIKQVSYGGQYGELPTPTREGYTFKGWNGKNLFNYEIEKNFWTPASDKSDINGEKVLVRKPEYDSNIWPTYKILFINFEDNKEYTISFDIWAEQNLTWNNRNLYINDKTILTHNLTDIKTTKQKLYATFLYKKGNNFRIHIYPKISPSDDCKIYISNFQVEEGNTMTEYEPYYVTESTKVTQTKNHTLTAIWEES